MKIETYIDSLVSYAMNKGLKAAGGPHGADQSAVGDLTYGRLCPSDEPQTEELEEILAGLLDYACEKGLCEDNVVARDLFDTKLMGVLTPMPREVIAIFKTLYEKAPKQQRIGIINLAVTRIISAVTGSLRICAGNMTATTAPSILPSI